jgi:hypothetical protein
MQGNCKSSLNSTFRNGSKELLSFEIKPDWSEHEVKRKAGLKMQWKTGFLFQKLFDHIGT